MAAYLEIELDTTAPEITWDAIELVRPPDELVIPFDLSESGIVSADLIQPDGHSYPAEIVGNELHFPPTLNRYFADGASEIRVVLEDDVGNRRVQTQQAMATNPRFPLWVRVENKDASVGMEDETSYIDLESGSVTVRIEKDDVS